MPATLRRLFLTAGLILVGFLIWHVGPRLVADTIVRVGWTFAAVVGLYGAYVVLRATALWRTLRPQVPYADVLRIRFSSEAVEALTFTGPFLAEPAKGWLLKTRGLSVASAFAAAITEYLIYAAVSSLVAVFGLSLLLARTPLAPGLHTAAVLVLTSTSVFLIAFVTAAVRGVGLIVPILWASRVVIGRRRAAIAVQWFSDVETLIIEFLHTRPRRCAEVVAIEMGAEVLLLSELQLIIAALSAGRPWLDALIVEGSVKFVALAFAFIPGQIGASETVYAVLAHAIGLSTAAGLGIALIRRLRSIAVGGIGLLAFFASGP